MYDLILHNYGPDLKIGSLHISVHDDGAFVARLIGEIQPLVPGMHLEIVVDHNYSE